MRHFLRACCFFFVTFSVFSASVELSRFKSIEERILSDFEKLKNKGPFFVVFDLDNTVIAPKTVISSDQWFEWQATLLKLKQGHKKYTVAKDYKELLRFIDLTMFYTPKRLTDPYLPKMFKNLRKKGVSVLGLTARGYVLDLVTERDLEKLGLDFSESAFSNFESYNQIPKGFERRVRLKNGVAYLSGQDKGKALKLLLENFDKNPGVIRFIDDKTRYLDQVENVITEMGIDYKGYRFTGEDDLVAEFKQGGIATLNPLKRQAIQEFKEFKNKGLCRTYVVPFRE